MEQPLRKYLFRSLRVKVGTTDADPDMLFTAKTTLDDCSSSLPPGQKYVAVCVLTGDTFYFVVDVNSKGMQLFCQVCNTLKVGKTELFGLAIYSDGIYHFIDPEQKLSKYAPKWWKVLRNNGIDNKQNILTFHFRVEIYVDCHLLVNDKVARHHYYLQLRENVIKYNQSINEERAFLLAAYALQADFGNYNKSIHFGNYFEPQKYFPLSIILRVGEAYIIKYAPAMHKDHTGLSCGEAEIGYIKEASNPVSSHNLHFYKMSNKKPKLSNDIWLGISPTGIELYKEDTQKMKSHLSTFLWADMAKLFFDRKKFEIRTCGCPEERKFTYYTNSEAEARNLLYLSKVNHQYYLATRTQVQILKKLEQEGRKPYRESYIYSDETDIIDQIQKESASYDISIFTKNAAENNKSSFNKSEDKKLKRNSHTSIPSIKLDAYESFMQNDSGHSSFAENRSNSASPDVTPQMLNEKLQHASLSITNITEDINLSSIPYHSNQVVSPNVNNLDCKDHKDCCHIQNSFNEQFSKLNENRITNNELHMKTNETSHNLTDPNSLKSCAVHGFDCNRIKPLEDKFNNLNCSDSAKESILSISDNSNQSTVETSAMSGRTRIGISSLSHPQKNGLHIQDKLHFMDLGPKSYKYQYNLSSDSGVSSPTNGTLSKTEKCSICSSQMDDGTVNNNFDNFLTTQSVLTFPGDELYIPPPPGYENSDEDISKVSNENKEIQNMNVYPELSKIMTPKQSAECCSSCSTTQIIDLQQLRKKSQDLGLPLLSALCNDRSLLMLPKTVPSCTRDRHLGINTNNRRFSCSAVNPSYTNEMCTSDEILGVRGRSHTTPQLRPISWHIDRDFPWQTSKVTEVHHIPALIENFSSNDNKEHTPLVTPSILTSFSTIRTDSSCVTPHLSIPTRQMIPTKLSSAFGAAPRTPSK